MLAEDVNSFAFAAAAVVAAFFVELVVDVAVAVSDADAFDDYDEVFCTRSSGCSFPFQTMRLADYR